MRVNNKNRSEQGLGTLVQWIQRLMLDPYIYLYLQISLIYIQYPGW